MNEKYSKILVVEDDGGFRRGLVKLFKKERFLVEDVVNAEQALEAIKVESPDVIVSDFKLPGIDGVELLRLVNSKPKSIRFILVSGHMDDDLHSRAINAGAFAAVAKPIDSVQLTELINA